MVNYKIENIEGVGPIYAAKLRKAGVKTTRALLKKGATPAGRRQLAEATGIDAKQILKWVNMADLFRIRGVGSEYAELLEKAGVDTVKELRHRNPENLQAKMTELNDNAQQVVRRLPPVNQVASWVEHASVLDPIILY